MTDKYTLRFLPRFESDLNEIVDYISVQLQNPTAAEKFVDDVEQSVYDRLPNAESFEPYRSAVRHQDPYYYIKVGNYLIFYVVIDDVMEVRRIIYGRRNMSTQL